MIICCKCGSDCGPGKGVSMCLFCTYMADFEVMDRSIKQDEEEAAKNATKVSFVIDKQDAEAILNLPLGKLTEEDLKPLER